MIFSFETAQSLTLDSASADHLRQMADIHARTFARPWTDGEIEQLLNQKATFGFVLRKPVMRGGGLVGFVLVRVAADEAEILTVAVEPAWHGYGCGRRLMDAALERAHRDRVSSIFLEVDETNLPAVALYTKLGFVSVGNRAGYYSKAEGDRGKALVMRRDLS